jgi:hypothetical protein
LVLEPLNRWPESGRRLVQSFICAEPDKQLKDPLALFMETRKSLLLAGRKPALAALQKEAFDLTVQAITQREREVWRTETLERMEKDKFKSRWSGSQIHSEPCRYPEFRSMLS